MKNEITIYLKDKSTRLFFEIMSRNYEIALPLLYKRVARSSLYNVRKYVKEYEDAAKIILIEEKLGIRNMQMIKLLHSVFPIRIEKNIAIITVGKIPSDTRMTKSINDKNYIDSSFMVQNELYN